MSFFAVYKRNVLYRKKDGSRTIAILVPTIVTDPEPSYDTRWHRIVSS